MNKKIVFIVILILIILGGIIFVIFSKMNRDIGRLDASEVVAELEVNSVQNMANIETMQEQESDNAIGVEVNVPVVENNSNGVNSKNEVKANTIDNTVESNTKNNTTTQNTTQNKTNNTQTTNTTNSVNQNKINNTSNTIQTNSTNNTNDTTNTTNTNETPSTQEVGERWQYNSNVESTLVSVIKETLPQSIVQTGKSGIISTAGYFTVNTKTDNVKSTIVNRVQGALQWAGDTIQVYARDYYKNGNYVWTECYVL
ncbi:MAG: hypothetical protein FWF46_06085 [Oscillospiraceae bacterium]|nr:hypothetical protein [Oscillospiraceae bacterium]